MSLFERVRSAARAVAARARFVRVDETRLCELAERLAPELASAGVEDPAHMRLGDDPATLAFVLALDAVNFGSGWFPVLRKPAGRSGYFTIAEALRRRFECAPLDARALSEIEAADCTALFEQDPSNAETEELMALFARSLRDLGRFTFARAGGSFEELVALAGGRAETLVSLLAEMPLYRDVARYDELEVPLLKRAQITAADLALAFEGRGPGRFADIDELTIFADNLVPHVLRCEGVLHYDPALLARIDAGALLEPGSSEEVEIRAVGLHAVERMAGHLRGRGVEAARARHLDRVLWGRGQSPAIKRWNRHRARTVFY